MWLEPDAGQACGSHVDETSYNTAICIASWLVAVAGLARGLRPMPDTRVFLVLPMVARSVTVPALVLWMRFSARSVTAVPSALAGWPVAVALGLSLMPDMRVEAFAW